jgi:glycosyltransferase involved in cell wall biosynthesis
MTRVSSPVTVMEIVHSMEVGGMERVVANLARRMDPARFRPMVVCIARKGGFAPGLEADGFEVVSLDKPPGVDLGAALRLARLIRKRRIDVVHLHNSGPLFTGTLAAVLTRVPVRIYTDHARVFPDRRRVMWTETALVRGIDRVVAVSDETRANMIRYLHVPAERIVVIPNGVEAPPETTEAQRLAARAEFGIAADAPLVVAVARLQPQKAIDRLIEAAALVRERVPAARFLVVGGGALEADLRVLVRDRGLDGVFHLAGLRMDPHVFLAAADVFALSSDWEGMPMSLLEALALGKPTACPDVGDVAKAVRTGETGILVRPGDATALADALTELLADPAGARAMGARGRALFGECFDAATMTRRYTQLFEEVLCRKG